MISLACFIILVHAFVPHHHHDFDNSVCFVFHSSHHDDSHTCGSDACDFSDGCRHEDKSPFELCKLQELLSCLVLSNREDDDFLCVQMSDVDWILLHSFGDLNAPVASEILPTGFDQNGWTVFCEDYPNASAFRAPPVC